MLSYMHQHTNMCPMSPKGRVSDMQSSGLLGLPWLQTKQGRYPIREPRRVSSVLRQGGKHLMANKQGAQLNVKAYCNLIG